MRTCTIVQSYHQSFDISKRRYNRKFQRQRSCRMTAVQSNHEIRILTRASLTNVSPTRPQDKRIQEFRHVSTTYEMVALASNRISHHPRRTCPRVRRHFAVAQIKAIGFVTFGRIERDRPSFGIQVTSVVSLRLLLSFGRPRYGRIRMRGPAVERWIGKRTEKNTLLGEANKCRALKCPRRIAVASRTHAVIPHYVNNT